MPSGPAGPPGPRPPAGASQRAGDGRDLVNRRSRGCPQSPPTCGLQQGRPVPLRQLPYALSLWPRTAGFWINERCHSPCRHDGERLPTDARCDQGAIAAFGLRSGLTDTGSASSRQGRFRYDLAGCEAVVPGTPSVGFVQGVRCGIVGSEQEPLCPLSLPMPAGRLVPLDLPQDGIAVPPARASRRLP